MTCMFSHGSGTCHLSRVDIITFKEFSSFPSVVLFSILSPADFEFPLCFHTRPRTSQKAP